MQTSVPSLEFCDIYSLFSYHHHSTSPKPFAIICERDGYRRTVFSNDTGYDRAISSIKSTFSNHRTIGIRVLAKYNDLLLCLHRYRHANAYDVTEFYICNPLTKHHAAIPFSPARRPTHGVVGFLCRGQSSFRVVHILRRFVQGRNHITAYVFSSEENKWTKYSLGADENGIISRYGVIIISRYGVMAAVPWNGILCWKPENTPTVVFYNPYIPDRFHSIAIVEYIVPGQAGFEVFQGTLRLWNLWQGLLSVWDLKDYDTAEWSLKHEVQIDELRWYNNRPVALDPNDEDVAYFATGRTLVCLNMRSKLKVGFKNINNDLPTGYDSNFFKLVMSGFPTPITTFPQNATAAMPFDRITRSRARSLQKAMELDK